MLPRPENDELRRVKRQLEYLAAQYRAEINEWESVLATERAAAVAAAVATAAERAAEPSQARAQAPLLPWDAVEAGFADDLASIKETVEQMPAVLQRLADAAQTLQAARGALTATEESSRALAGQLGAALGQDIQPKALIRALQQSSVAVDSDDS